MASSSASIEEELTRRVWLRLDRSDESVQPNRGTLPNNKAAIMCRICINHSPIFREYSCTRRCCGRRSPHSSNMLIKIRNDLYVGWRGRWCLRKIKEVRLVKSKLLMCHITVQRRNMTSNTAGVAVTAMRAVTVIIGIERKRINAIQDM